MTTVWIYVDTSKEVGDVDHLKVFATPELADEWLKRERSGRRSVRLRGDRRMKPPLCSLGNNLPDYGRVFPLDTKSPDSTPDTLRADPRSLYERC